MSRCRNCGGSPVHAKERCKACHQYLRRNDRERPMDLVIRANKHALERRIFRRRMAESA